MIRGQKISNATQPYRYFYISLDSPIGATQQDKEAFMDEFVACNEIMYNQYLVKCKPSTTIQDIMYKLLLTAIRIERYIIIPVDVMNIGYYLCRYSHDFIRDCKSIKGASND